MADQPTTPNPEDESNGGSIFDPTQDIPIEDTELEVEDAHPRRQASAEFVVQADAGSTGVLREAMDPANQSLADALRMSYRVLQLVIVILVVLFLVSGFKRIEVSKTGIMTMFGRIHHDSVTGSAELGDGLSVGLPYPASEFIVFDRTAAVDLLSDFWPNVQIGRDTTYEAAAARIRASDAMALGLGPNRDGMVLVEDGIGHAQLRAAYEIVDPEKFVNKVNGPEAAKRMVTYALQRGMVQVASGLKLDEMVDQSELVAERVQAIAREQLARLDSGIDLQRVQAINLQPPVSIFNVMQQLGTAQAAADAARSEARRERSTLLIDAAGQDYQELLDLIAQYEQIILASELGTDDPEANSVQVQIDAMLESDRIGGMVAQRIAAANAYQETIVSTLGGYADRFENLLPTYRANPEYLVRLRLIDTFGSIVESDLTETFQIPAGIQIARVSITSDSAIMLDRRRASQIRREQQARGDLPTREEKRFGDNGTRRLEIDEQGNVVGRGRERNQSSSRQNQ